MRVLALPNAQRRPGRRMGFARPLVLHPPVPALELGRVANWDVGQPPEQQPPQPRTWHSTRRRRCRCDRAHAMSVQQRAFSAGLLSPLQPTSGTTGGARAPAAVRVGRGRPPGAAPGVPWSAHPRGRDESGAPARGGRLGGLVGGWVPLLLGHAEPRSCSRAAVPPWGQHLHGSPPVHRAVVACAWHPIALLSLPTLRCRFLHTIRRRRSF